MESILRARLTFIEDILGTASSDPEIYDKYIGANAPSQELADEELENLSSPEDERAITVFPRDGNGDPFLYDYQIKGFFKDSCSMLARLTGKTEDGKRDKTKAVNESGKMLAFKKVIDGLIFVTPRQIPFQFDGEVTTCQRPLRASTPQGERVALACSESIPAGAKIEFNIVCMDDKNVKAVKEWLNYGFWRGIGQWRNSGKGRFVWEELDEDGNVIGGNKKKMGVA